MRLLFKNIILCVVIAMFCLSFMSCGYVVPEGYTTVHHTYDEALEYAKSIDSLAEVSRVHNDSKIDEWDRNFREWNATINGIECHVASVGIMVWNEKIPGIDLVKQFYRLDTDYDYCLLQNILSDSYPGWGMRYSDIDERYNAHGIIGVNTSAINSEELADEDLLLLWNHAKEIYEEFSSKSLGKMPYFYLSVPQIATRGNDDEEYIRMTVMFIKDFSDEAKEEFFADYSKRWDIMDLDLPFED